MICYIYLHFKLLLIVEIVNNHSVMQLVTSLTPQRITFDPRPIRAGNTVIKLQWDGYFCKYFSFLLPLSLHQYCMLIQLSPMSYHLINCRYIMIFKNSHPLGSYDIKPASLLVSFPRKPNTFRKRVKNVVTSKGIQVGIERK